MIEENSQRDTTKQELDSLKAEIKILSAGYGQLDRSLGHAISISRFAFGFVVVLLSLLTIAGSIYVAIIRDIDEGIKSIHMAVSGNNNATTEIISTIDRLMAINESLVGRLERFEKRVGQLEDQSAPIQGFPEAP